MTSWFLSTVHWPSMALGTLLALVGLTLLYRAWCARRRRWELIAAGWGLIACAYWPWTLAAGFDRGATAGSCLLMSAALIAIAFRGDWRAAVAMGQTSPARPAPAPSEQPNRRVGPRTLRFLVAGPLAGGASLMLALLVFALLPSSEPNRLMAAALICTLLWSVLVAWSAATENLARVAALLGGTAGGAALLTTVLM